MVFQKINREYLFLLAAVLFSALIVVPIILIGIPDTVDLPQHFRFADTFYSSIINGDLFPGWAGNENFGYGDIGIRFYPPLAYYFLAIGRIIAGNWYDATWLTFMFWMVVGCFGIYYWARNWFSIKESSIIAIIYVLIPFHLNQLYTGFNPFSELAASSILTFCFAFLTKVLTREKTVYILGLGCFYALLIMTHLPTAIVGSICLFGYSLTFCRKADFTKHVSKAALAVCIGLAASAFYWIRLITEMKWLNHESERYSQGFFDFAGNFFPLSYHIKDKPVFNYLILDLTALITVLTFAFALVFLLNKQNNSSDSIAEKSISKTVLPVGIFAFLMFTPLSAPVWELITPIQKIQFPLRWMPVAAMCGAIVFGAALNYVHRAGFFKRKICFYAFFVFIVINLLFNFTYILHPSSYIPLERQKFEAKIKNLPDEPSFYCWWAVWAKLPALENTERLQTDSRTNSILDWKTEHKSFFVDPGTPSNARIATFYYPFWKAMVNGRSVEVERDENGAILIPIPAEKVRVDLVFEEPPINNASGIFSLGTWLLLLLILIFSTRRSRIVLSDLDF